MSEWWPKTNDLKRKKLLLFKHKQFILKRKGLSSFFQGGGFLG